MKLSILFVLAALLSPFAVPLPAALKLSDVEVVRRSDCEPNHMGYYEDSKVYLCDNNIKDEDTVLRHELVHHIQQNFNNATLVPEPFLTGAVRLLEEDGKVMYVLLEYDNTTEEFEARVLDNLPNNVISGLLIYSELFDTYTN